jgi:uncharacterized protein
VLANHEGLKLQRYFQNKKLSLQQNTHLLVRVTSHKLKHKQMKHLIIGFLLTISIIGFAQNGDKNFIDQNYIEVTGKAEMEVVPDMIYLKIILSDKDNKNKQSLDEIDKTMISKLKEIGVEVSKDLSIKDFTSNFKSYWISKTDILLTKQYQLIIHDTKTLQKVYFEFQKLGISNVSIDKLDHSKIEQFRKEVKINAIKAAKDKAESLAIAINQTIGKALFIQETDFSTPSLITNALQGSVSGINVRLRGASNYSNDTSNQDIEFEKINLVYSILVRFELK